MITSDAAPVPSVACIPDAMISLYQRKPFLGCFASVETSYRLVQCAKDGFVRSDHTLTQIVGPLSGVLVLIAQHQGSRLYLACSDGSCGIRTWSVDALC